MKKTNFDLTKKNCIITGAAGILGAEHAEALLDVNANLILTDVNINKLNLLKKKLLKSYPYSNILYLNMDVTKEKSILIEAMNLFKLC
jgi:NADP-dependent 3-hydroxy acid dehydrogenase YdfG